MTAQPLPFDQPVEPVRKKRGGVQRTAHQRSVRATSVNAAREEWALLERRQRNVVTWLASYRDEAPTSRELAEWSKPLAPGRSVHEHLSDVRIGLSDNRTHCRVTHAGKRECRITHKVTLTWKLVTP